MNAGSHALGQTTGAAMPSGYLKKLTNTMGRLETGRMSLGEKKGREELKKEKRKHREARDGASATFPSQMAMCTEIAWSQLNCCV